MSEHTWATTTRISVSGTPVWHPVERLDVAHSGGRAVVRVERFPAPPDTDIDTLAALHAERLAIPGWTDGGTTPHEVLDHPDGLRRTASWTDQAGTRLQAVVDYALHSARLVVITTVTPVGDHALEQEAAAVRDSVRISDPVQISVDQLPLRPGRVDLAGLAAAWRSGTSPEAGEEHVVTTEESFGAARHFGVAMLPGADTSSWDQLDAAQRDLAAAVAWRSLEVRGAGEGTDLAEALQLGASHDLILMVCEQQDRRSHTQWFAARLDRMVRIRPSGPGRMALSTHPTAVLADLVLADLAMADAGPGHTMTASAVYRVDGHVVGDEATWTSDASAAEVREALGRLVTRSHVNGAT